MRHLIQFIGSTTIVALALAIITTAQNEQTSPVVQRGRVIVPDSSVERPEDAGIRAHTNYLIFVPEGEESVSLAPSPSAETPASLGCIYQVGPTYPGCNRSTGGTRHPVGGWGAIAIVDAFHNPYAASDLATFSTTYGLPAANFTQIYCGSKASGIGCYTTTPPPRQDTGWGLEEALDIEWAHAMAPNAQIFLIEAYSNSPNDLTWAEAWAGHYVYFSGGGEISNSWGSAERSDETTYDPYFNNYYGYYVGVVYLAASADTLGTHYPSCSPYVVSAGGTTVNRDSSGNFLYESGWYDPAHGWAGGGGQCSYEARPSYQNMVSNIVGSARGTPDLSFDGNPATGVSVYDAFNGGWFVLGGTSLASPALAGIINLSGTHLASSSAENGLLYSELPMSATFFYDVTSGRGSQPCTVGYDLCSGIGTPRSSTTILTTQTPTAIAVGGGYENATRFTSSQSGYITALRFYKVTGETGPHTLRLWSDTGTLLASVTTSNESASGWQEKSLSPPVAITANVNYRVSYTDNVQVGKTWYVFSNGGTISNPPLTANKGYWGPGGAFPTTASDSNLFADVRFHP